MRTLSLVAFLLGLAALTGCGAELDEPEELEVGQASSAVSLAPGLSNVRISVGGRHVCAIVNFNNGGADRLYCWGDNSFGQLGNPSIIPSANAPIAVALPGTPKLVAAGKNDTCAIVTPPVGGDRLYCWGENAAGQLGLGTATAPVLSPTLVTIPSASTAVPKSVSLGGEHGCGIFFVSGANRAYCWGKNSVGQLGLGNFTSAPAYYSPQLVSLLPGAVKKVELGFDHSCATSTVAGFDNLYCWGNGADYALGTGTFANQSTPALINAASPSSPTAAVTLGRNDTCILEPSAGNPSFLVQYCFGANNKGQTGTGATTANVASTGTVSLLSGNWETVLQSDLGDRHGCFIMTNVSSGKKQLACWGDNAQGQLGTASIPLVSLKPIATSITAGAPSYVSAGGNTTCVVVDTLTLGQQIYCFGDNSTGQVGAATTAQKHDTAQQVFFLSPGISVGDGHACALLRSGGVKCWGYDGGRLGQGTAVAPQASAVQVHGLNNVGFLSGVKALSGGTAHCALLVSGEVACWGDNSYGQLGNGTTSPTPQYFPTLVPGLTNVKQISVGTWHACAVLNSGVTKCWGSNGDGEIGIGYTSATPIAAPTVVPLAMGAQSVMASYTNTCAVLTNGTAQCWGSNLYGQVGVGVLPGQPPIPTPTVVPGVSNIKAITGSGSMCAHLTNNTVTCWGYNVHGEMGQGTASLLPQTVPALVPGVSGVKELSLRTTSSFALMNNGTVMTWGWNITTLVPGVYCGVPNGFPGSNLSPVAYPGVTGAVNISSGGCNVCVLMANDTVKCWGDNNYQQTGSTSTATTVVPQQVPNVP